MMNQNIKDAMRLGNAVRHLTADDDELNVLPLSPEMTAECLNYLAVAVVDLAMELDRIIKRLRSMEMSHDEP